MPSPTIVVLPMWAPGHFSSMLEAGRRLLFCSAGVTATFSLTVLVTPPPISASSDEVSNRVHGEMMAAGDGIVFHQLPAIEHRTGTGLVHPSEYIQLYAPHVKEAIAGLAAPVAAVVVDVFGTPLLDVAHDLAVPAYVYFTSTAAMLALLLRLPAILQQEDLTSRSLLRVREEGGGVVNVPGLPPVPVACLPSPDVNDYAWFAYYGRRFLEARGIVVNTAAELEPGVLASIADGRCKPGRSPPPMVYPIGPVVSPKPPRRSSSSSAHECIILRWLDAQPAASVVFLCFGSQGWMSAEQAREVAAGLERSEHRFLWVLRGAPAAGSSSRYPTDANLNDLVPDPEGFLERTKGKGLVWPTWAPQREILVHAAVGGFVTHCGWNSVLESLWHGVPMAPWPLYAEQPLNAFELVACMGVAVELRVGTGTGRSGNNNFVEAAELELAVRSLMGGSEEGRKAREKAMEMKSACRKAVEKGGSSYAATQAVVQGMLQSYVPAGPK